MQDTLKYRSSSKMSKVRIRCQKLTRTEENTTISDKNMLRVKTISTTNTVRTQCSSVGRLHGTHIRVTLLTIRYVRRLFSSEKNRKKKKNNYT